MPRKRKKRASEEQIQTAISILERMSQSGQQVHVMVLWPLFMTTFGARIVKHRKVDDLFTLNAGEFTISVSPRFADTLLVHPDGGLFLERDRMAMTIEPGEHTAEELVARYPAASKLTH
jgi:hypothetical protein